MTDYDKGWNEAIEAAARAIQARAVAYNSQTPTDAIEIVINDAHYGEAIAAAQELHAMAKPVPPPRNCACRGDGDGKFTVHTPNSCWDGMRLP